MSGHITNGHRFMPGISDEMKEYLIQQARLFDASIDRDVWTPCWSAHAYGWDDAWWREASLDGELCRCPAEKIARNREQGRLIMERRR